MMTKVYIGSNTFAIIILWEDTFLIYQKNYLCSAHMAVSRTRYGPEKTNYPLIANSSIPQNTYLYWWSPISHAK